MSRSCQKLIKSIKTSTIKISTVIDYKNILKDTHTLHIKHIPPPTHPPLTLTLPYTQRPIILTTTTTTSTVTKFQLHDDKTLNKYRFLASFLHRYDPSVHPIASNYSNWYYVKILPNPTLCILLYPQMINHGVLLSLTCTCMRSHTTKTKRAVFLMTDWEVR